MKRKKTNNILTIQKNEQDVGGLVRKALLLWGCTSPSRMIFFMRITWRMLLAKL